MQREVLYFEYVFLVPMLRKVKPLLLILVLILTACKSSRSVKEYGDIDQTQAEDKYQQEFDEELFRNEKLEMMNSLDERLDYFKKENRIIYYYDKDWEITTPDSASYINTVKHIKDDLYMVRNYFITGERKTAGIVYNMKGDCEWNRIYSDRESQFRKIGKNIYWYKIGWIEFIQFTEWSDWEKGYYSSNHIDVENYQIAAGRDFIIKNTSKLKAEEIYCYKEGDSLVFSLPGYFGGIRAHNNGTLTFSFGNKRLYIVDGSVRAIAPGGNITGSFPPAFATRGTNVYNYKRLTSLGSATLKLTTGSCNDTSIHSFFLEAEDGEVLVEGLLNTEMFLIDADGDGIDEIYLFSFRSCEGNLKKLIRVRK